MNYYCKPRRWYNQLYLLAIKCWILRTHKILEEVMLKKLIASLKMKMAKNQVLTIIFAIVNYWVYGATYCMCIS